LASYHAAIQHVFLVVNFFLQLDFINAMIHALICQICILGSVVRALLCQREMASSDPNGVLLLTWQRSAKAFKIFGTQTISFPEPG
jgi:hypothetical protein